MYITHSKHIRSFPKPIAGKGASVIMSISDQVQTQPEAGALTPVKRALISVSDKTGVVEFARALASRGVEIVSTGGTHKLLSESGVPVTAVEAYTGHPEIMDGRVKTLHPKVHGGILAVRDNPKHVKEMGECGIGAIDMVAVNLYPFEKTVAGGAGIEECVENIDIGGPAMVRSAAKNHAFVTVVVDPADYAAIEGELSATAGRLRSTPGGGSPSKLSATRRPTTRL